MPRFFFHTTDGHRDQDAEGVELADKAAARVAAIRFAGEVMSDEPDVLWDGGEFRVEVTDESGRKLCTVLMSAVDEADAAPD